MFPEYSTPILRVSPVLDPDQYTQLMMEGNLVAEVGMVVLDTLSLYTQQFKVTASCITLIIVSSIRWLCMQFFLC